MRQTILKQHVLERLRMCKMVGGYSRLGLHNTSFVWIQCNGQHYEIQGFFLEFAGIFLKIVFDQQLVESADRTADMQD